MELKKETPIPSLGTIGHVDHGRTTLTTALTTLLAGGAMSSKEQQESMTTMLIDRANELEIEQSLAKAEDEVVERGITITEHIEKDRSYPIYSTDYIEALATYDIPGYNIKKPAVHHNQKNQIQPKKKAAKRRLAKQNRKKNR